MSLFSTLSIRYVFGYFHHSVNGISYVQAQSDPIKGYLLYNANFSNAYFTLFDNVFWKNADGQVGLDVSGSVHPSSKFDRMSHVPPQSVFVLGDLGTRISHPIRSIL